ncbi:MAG: hypothetical protein AAGU11_07345, partial [Syntrophobacteraceae bacterium]
ASNDLRPLKQEEVTECILLLSKILRRCMSTFPEVSAILPVDQNADPFSFEPMQQKYRCPGIRS